MDLDLGHQTPLHIVPNGEKVKVGRTCCFWDIHIRFYVMKKKRISDLHSLSYLMDNKSLLFHPHIVILFFITKLRLTWSILWLKRKFTCVIRKKNRYFQYFKYTSINFLAISNCFCYNEDNGLKPFGLVENS